MEDCRGVALSKKYFYCLNLIVSQYTVETVNAARERRGDDMHQRLRAGIKLGMLWLSGLNPKPLNHQNGQFFALFYFLDVIIIFPWMFNVF